MAGLIRPYKGILPRIAPDAWIAETAVVIGDVEIGPETGIWYGCLVRGDVHAIRIGARTNIQDGTVIHVTTGRFGTTIGSDITVGHMALLHGCELQDGCFIGMRATVMDGAVVEAGAMVAAGALVTPGKRIPAGQVWGGSPARFMREVSEQERAFFPLSAAHYVDLGQTYRKDG